MKKSYVLIVLFLVFIVFITVIGSVIITGNVKVKVDKDILLVQSNKEVYFSVYGYSIDNPNVVINPYGNSPLTALIMFETDNYSEVEITIKSKNGNSDINYKFSKDKYHMIPIYGLYADYDNTVIIKSEGKENIINIKTDKLPLDFEFLDTSSVGNFMFYNSNYPSAIDNEGEVRWYLNEKYFGNITFLDNSSIVIGSNRYDEDGNTVSFYKMNLLGKIYNEYLLSDSYYGYSALYEDNLLVLSDKLLLIDIQTGNVIREYTSNDDYDYLGVYEDSIIVGKNGVFYKVLDDGITEVEYNFNNELYSFYNNTSNYRVVPSNRFGVLYETLSSDKKVALVSYDKLDVLEDIEIIQEIDRIKITNNSGNKIYFILDKFMDKRVYEVNDLKYINTNGLNGKYTVYLKIEDTLYKTDYYIEV